MSLVPRRLAGILVIAIAAIGVHAAPAGAAKIGNPDVTTPGTFGEGCVEGVCIWVQRKLPGAQLRAPFSGRITKWRLQTSGAYASQLVVMRKRRNGKFKAIRASATESSPGAGVHTYSTSLRIRKRDYVGVASAQIVGVTNPEGRYWIFSPALALGGSGMPTFPGTDELLFNATVRR